MIASFFIREQRNALRSNSERNATARQYLELNHPAPKYGLLCLHHAFHKTWNPSQFAFKFVKLTMCDGRDG